MNGYRELMPYVRRELRLYILSFVGSLFRFLLPLAIPLIIRHIFDHMLQNGSLSGEEKIGQLTVIAAGTLIVFLLIRAPMEYVRQFFMHKATNNIIKAMRKDAFRKVHQLDAKYFTDNKSGEIGTRFFDDIEKVRGFMTAAMSNIWIEMIVLLFVVIVMFTLNLTLTLLAAGLVSFQFGLAHVLSRRFKKTTGEMFGYRSVLSGFVFEKIQGASIAKQFAAEHRDEEQLAEHLTRYEKWTDKHARLNALTLSSVNVLSDLTPFLVVLAGSLFVIDGNLTPGSLIAFYAYVDRMRGPVSALVQAFPTIAEGKVALRRIFDFLQIPSSITEKPDAVQLKSFRDRIQFREVSFGYQEDGSVLEEISFCLERGKTYAFVGGSGGGKSTILQLLIRMYDVKSGSVTIDGVDIRDYTLASLKEHMGIVTQDNFLYSSSIRDNIRTAKLDATDEEIVEAARKAYAHDFIMAMPQGYDTEIGERGVKLSGGQKQRIALARVFLKNPSIIILDEATSALDNESERLVQQSIERLSQEKTVIMIAHRLSTVVHADTIFVVKDGRIVESGSHHSLLMKNGFYSELYEKQPPQQSASKPVVASA